MSSRKKKKQLPSVPIVTAAEARTMLGISWFVHKKLIQQGAFPKPINKAGLPLYRRQDIVDFANGPKIHDPAKKRQDI